ncbi:hypothetical protein BG003_005609 [Podila horticola]|nr:hypothetical protein BG003_005609 [Podila horticola]
MPALRRAHTDAALPVWAHSYNIAKNLQVALIGTSLLSGLGVYYKTDNIQYLIPPALLAIAVPFTYAFIMPVNHELLGILNGTGKKNHTVEQLLNKWDLLHFGRTVLSMTAFVLALYGTYSDKAAIHL